MVQFLWHHSRVPVLFGDPVQAGEHDGQDDAGVLLDQTHNVLVVPVVESSLCNLGRKYTHWAECLSMMCKCQISNYLFLHQRFKSVEVTDLEVWAGDTSGDLFEERLLDLYELCWFDDVQDFLKLP